MYYSIRQMEINSISRVIHPGYLPADLRADIFDCLGEAESLFGEKIWISLGYELARDRLILSFYPGLYRDMCEFVRYLPSDFTLDKLADFLESKNKKSVASRLRSVLKSDRDEWTRTTGIIFTEQNERKLLDQRLKIYWEEFSRR